MTKISFRTIIPDGKFEFDIFDEEITKAMKNVAKPEIKALFDRTVEGWEDRVNFRGTIRRSRGRFIVLTVQPYGRNADLYALVNEGARPHPIMAINAPALKFRSGYRASTRRGSLSSRRKQRSGAWVITPIVNHPGFEGRIFDETIAKEYDPRFHEVMSVAVEKATVRQARELK